MSKITLTLQAKSEDGKNSKNLPMQDVLDIVDRISELYETIHIHAEENRIAFELSNKKHTPRKDKRAHSVGAAPGSTTF